MGTPPDAPTPDFRVSPPQERTDSREEEEEFPTERRKTEQRETPRAKKEPDHPETISETREADPRWNQDAKSVCEDSKWERETNAVDRVRVIGVLGWCGGKRGSGVIISYAPVWK
ncbi:hypothetical protein NDU88_002781 [Pleurodeles waltl]|uniref:Uncharacterized protein n=1 Tax=Pleurodeles waltl TaxID=8319 RepID=A0AAV7LF21_PLEWA|nr:hypothetical protein NDU88_002781 [Pleurodeles waltl]